MTSSSTSVTLELHPLNCDRSCTPDLLACSFGRTLQGTHGGKPVTFSLGSEGNHLMLIANGCLTEEEFRAVGTYTRAVVQNPRYVNTVLSANYSVYVGGRATIEANGDFPRGDILIVGIGS